GTIESFYDANVQLTAPNAPFSFYDPRCPIYTHQRFLPPSRVVDSRIVNGLVAEGSYLDRCDVSDSVIGIRSVIRQGARIRRSVLLGADYYEGDADERPDPVPLGIGPGVEIDRAIVDKNARIGDGARLVNTRGIDEQDGDGYYIRNGIIIV